MKGIRINKRPIKRIRAKHLSIPALKEEVKIEAVSPEQIVEEPVDNTEADVVEEKPIKKAGKKTGKKSETNDAEAIDNKEDKKED